MVPLSHSRSRRTTPKRLLVASTVLAVCASAVALTVSVPLAAPASASALAPTLVSFSIEQDRWPGWTGTTARNAFTSNALANYAALTGRAPTVRVGADSEDRTTFAASEVLVSASFPAPDAVTPFPEASRVTVGAAYYALARFLPPGTHMVWGVNLGANDPGNAVSMAKAIVAAFEDPDVRAAGIVLDRLEVGNEPDLYTTNRLRASGWGVDDYMRDWEASAGAVAQAVGLGSRGGPVTFQGAAFAGQGSFSPKTIFDLGILRSSPGKAISTISQHHYSAFFCSGGSFSLESFMSKVSIRSNLSTFSADIAATRAQGLDYILGETNSVACHGAPGVSNTAGAALWAIDYMLQAATLGIKETYFHHGVGYKYNFFQPIALNRSTTTGKPLSTPQPPHILPAYYAGLVVNTLIGRTGVARVSELPVADDALSAYAAFENGKLARLAIVDLSPWLKSSTGARPTRRVALDFAAGGLGNRTLVARRLVAPHADDTAGLTWAGRSFETADALPVGQETTEVVDPARGVSVRASEAVVVELVAANAGGGASATSAVSSSATAGPDEATATVDSTMGASVGGAEASASMAREIQRLPFNLLVKVMAFADDKTVSCLMKTSKRLHHCGARFLLDYSLISLSMDEDLRSLMTFLCVHGGYRLSYLEGLDLDIPSLKPDSAKLLERLLGEFTSQTRLKTLHILDVESLLATRPSLAHRFAALSTIKHIRFGEVGRLGSQMLHKFRSQLVTVDIAWKSVQDCANDSAEEDSRNPILVLKNSQSTLTSLVAHNAFVLVDDSTRPFHDEVYPHVTRLVLADIDTSQILPLVRAFPNLTHLDFNIRADVMRDLYDDPERSFTQHCIFNTSDQDAHGSWNSLVHCGAPLIDLYTLAPRCPTRALHVNGPAVHAELLSAVLALTRPVQLVLEEVDGTMLAQALPWLAPGCVEKIECLEAVIVVHGSSALGRRVDASVMVETFVKHLSVWTSITALALTIVCVSLPAPLPAVDADLSAAEAYLGALDPDTLGRRFQASAPSLRTVLLKLEGLRERKSARASLGGPPCADFDLMQSMAEDVDGGDGDSGEA
ncbi:uncharacterized protein BXZ73DRAFT_100205 [Epithele typhae]|uniref:uncharacterized protein n=1 Tax=Epithele typhae TaxID=378194 RepID=UPI0020077B2F|nr:uncharacterized protein BXZ73DRAFT_100205 [Epithele typhae]KAH9936781.1 hypothetical protein BXZ73DRAFT_100205 [Epithele typhae]